MVHGFDKRFYTRFGVRTCTCGFGMPFSKIWSKSVTMSSSRSNTKLKCWDKITKDLVLYTMPQTLKSKIECLRICA